MSLLDEMKQECVMLDKQTIPDGYGGFSVRYVDGAVFFATVIKDSSTQAQIAEKSGLSEIFTVVVDSGLQLDFHDVFRRTSDGQIFRVTSNITDSVAPARSTVQIGKVSAEKWVLPSA